METSRRGLILSCVTSGIFVELVSGGRDSHVRPSLDLRFAPREPVVPVDHAGILADHLQNHERFGKRFLGMLTSTVYSGSTSWTIIARVFCDTNWYVSTSDIPVRARTQPIIAL